MSNPLLRWLLLTGILLFSAILGLTGARHAIVEHWADSSNPDLWLRAAAWEPANAENWYRLGRYRQLDFEGTDLPLAISYYQRALAIDPGAAAYWMDLAEAYEISGNVAQAEEAFRKAQQAYPISADVAWRLGNFLLRQGNEDEAFEQIHRAVSTDPKLTELALSRCWRSTQDIERILRIVLPDREDVDWGAIDFFVSAGEPDAAMAVWKRLIGGRPSLPISKTFHLLDMLIASGRAEDTQTVWQQALTAAGIVPPPGPAHSLIWDGSFEGDLLNGGLAWRYRPVAGTAMDLDQETVHSGGRSLRVIFDGTSNVDLADPWQYVVVQPNTRYRFSAYLRTQELTTESGVRFEIDDVKQPANLHVVTPSVVGTQPWALDEIEFTTGPDTRLLSVALRRTQSEMLANKIRGTAWVDDVSLVPTPPTPAASLDGR